MAVDSDLQIAQLHSYLKSFRFSAFKVCKELEDNNGQVLPVAKCKKHQQRSDSVKTHEFIQQV